MRLPYLDVVKMHVVDPMHIIFLGLVKDSFMVLIETLELNDAMLETVDERRTMLRVPSNMGRITKSIAKNYKSLNSHEWKSWAIIYSAHCLHGLISQEKYNLLLILIQAVTILSKPYCSIALAEKAIGLIREYNSKFEQIYGGERSKPNMHMAVHILGDIKNYGPIPGFWCFAFERLNGHIGKYQTKSQSLAVSIMRKFTLGNCVLSQIDNRLIPKKKDNNYSDIEKLADSHQKFVLLADRSLVEVLSKVYRRKLVDEDVCSISAMLSIFLRDSFVKISNVCDKILKVRLGNITLKTSTKNCISTALGLHVWDRTSRPLSIESIYQVKLFVNNNGNQEACYLHVVEAEWFKESPHRHNMGVNNPIELWSTQSEPYGEKSFLPLTFILNKNVVIKKNHKIKRANLVGNDVFRCVIPIPKH